MYGRSWMRRILTKYQCELQAEKYGRTTSRPACSKDSARKILQEHFDDGRPVNDSDNYIDNYNSIQRTPTLHLSFGDADTDENASTAKPTFQRDKGASLSQDTFHCAVSPILILGQCFAIMPVRGVQASNPLGVRFTYKYFPVLVTLFFLVTSSVLTLTTLQHLLNIGVSPKNFVGLVFFGCAQGACVLFLSLATRWPRLIRDWEHTEKLFTTHLYATPQRRLAQRIRRSAIVIVILSALEHCLFLGNAVTSYWRRTHDCAHVHNTTGEVSFEEYMRQNYDYVFQVLPYHTVIGATILIINGACTFTWNYMDLFIMMISKGIAYRFEQISVRIRTLADKEVSEFVFMELREHYVKLCELLDYVDDNLSGIILLSSLNNLYFVCYQLLNIFNKLRWPITYIYFWYSLLYLMGRTAYVCLAAASINDEAKGALNVLRRVSSSTWCVEVERLIFQMKTQIVALSGKKFYFLTRHLLFGMAGTIVTYELVLLQFDEPNRSKGLPDLCA